MFRGKESLNRVELSRLVQELFNFGVFGFLHLLGVGGGWGVPPTHIHMHTHAHTHKHANACVVNMVISCKWPPPLGEYLGIPYDIICVCMCMHVHACMWVGYTLSTPPPLFRPHPPGGPQNHSKFNST